MADISLVGVRLVVEGQQAASAELTAFDAKAKAVTTSLQEMGGTGVQQGLSRLVVSVEDVGGSMGRTAGSASAFHGILRDLDGTLSSVSSNLMTFTAYGLGGAALGFAGLATAAATFGVRAASSFEQTRISFETMLGSVSRGDALFKTLQQFNYQTPFGLPDITHSAQTLLQYGFTDTTLMPVLRTLANVASVAPAGEQSQDLMRTSLAIGQISSAGVVRGQDINQLTQAGFPIMKLLQQVTGMSGGQLEAQLRGGGLQLPASQLISAIAGGGGPVLDPYNQAALRQSKSGAGQWSNFTDTLRSDLATGSLPLLQSLTGILPQLTTSIDRVFTVALPPINAFFTNAAQSLPGFVDHAVPALQGFFAGLERNGPMIAGFFKDLVSLLPDLAHIGADLVPIVDGLARGFHELLSLPFGIGTGLVAGMLVALTGYNALSGTAKVVRGMAEALDLLTASEGRRGITPGGKALAGAAGAAGLALSASDAYQHGPSFSNVAGGAVSGAVLGGTLASVVPGLGTAVGAGVGAVVGGGAAFLSGELHQHHHVTIAVENPTSELDVHKAIDSYYHDSGQRAADAYGQAFGR